MGRTALWGRSSRSARSCPGASTSSSSGSRSASEEGASMTLTRRTLSTFLAAVAGVDDGAVPQMLTGGWLHNPVTGELGRLNVGPAETGGRGLETDPWLPPRGALAPAPIPHHFYQRLDV